MATDDDEMAGWGDKLEGKEAPAVGVNRDVLKAALQMNPNLRGREGNTADIMTALEKGAAARPASNGKEQATSGSRDLFTVFKTLKERHQEDEKRLRAEMAAAQKGLQALAPKTLERVLDALVDIDPNLVSVQTQELLRVEGQFLSGIGFSGRKVVERKAEKAKRK